MGIITELKDAKKPFTPPDLSHHLSTETLARLPNVMKDMARLMQSKPTMVSLANGDPHVSLFPIRSVNFEVAAVGESNPVAVWRTGSASSQSFQTTADVPDPSSLGLSEALSYGPGVGTLTVLDALQKLVDTLHAPSNHVVTLTLGNADGVAKVFRLLANPGDSFLADEFTFTGITSAAVAHGVKWVPVRMDEGGMIPEDVEHILKTWDVEKQGKRPHAMYIIPCGQNPTGSTLSLERRKRIYKTAQEYDLIIIEDDPYGFFTFNRPELDVSDKDFLSNYSASFIPSFLSMDVDGRVMRHDSFSKIIAPGMRIGMMTTNPAFQEHLIRLTDNTTQQPCGFAQMFLAEMLGERGWKMDGFARWIDGLSKEYQRRRDFFLETFDRLVKPTGYASATTPQAGMFFWIKIHVDQHPQYTINDNIEDKTAPRTNCAELMQQLFMDLIDANLAVIPAMSFLANRDPKALAREDGNVIDRVNYIRATFAGTEEVMEAGLSILGKTLSEFFAQ